MDHEASQAELRGTSGSARNAGATPPRGTHAQQKIPIDALAMMFSEEQYRAWGEMLYSVRTGKPAFEHQFGMGVFEYFACGVQQAMSDLTVPSAGAIADSYDFSGFRTIVHVNDGFLHRDSHP